MTDYCPACRATGALHCAHPEECGQMMNIRNAFAEELLRRLESDLAQGVDYCIGEEPLRRLIEDFRASK